MNQGEDLARVVARSNRRVAGWLLGALLIWLWPIGTGGKMPVGGDVTQFSLGPMSVLSRSLKAGRLPLWNDLWGYGFPGVGESQMGVYYPVHWALYGPLAPETAYTVSLVVHTLWGGLGAWFAARRFGVSSLGAFLCGFSWATCGFFVIHLPHQWAYTAGSWMPWAWGLGWTVARGEGGRREPFLLAGVLALQLLPGHFQLAFCTQVGLLVLAAATALERRPGRAGGVTGGARVLAALGGAFGLAFCQVAPTLRLARLAAQGRDFEYLSGFAASPLHLVTFLAPGLFETSPLWRPLVWDPFHTSPEEYLGYVGLVPLFLAGVAVVAGGRRSAEVRALAVVACVTAWLALGPYAPGFRALCRLPGFSFFRAPARWSLALSLALCLLAGVGFDRLGRLRSPGRALAGFAFGAAVLIGVVVGSVELALRSAAGPGRSAVEATYSRLLDALPWNESGVFRRAVSASRQANRDPRVDEAWARQGVDLEDPPGRVFEEGRAGIYRQELRGTALVLLALLAVAALTTGARRRHLAFSLLILSVLDAGLVGWVDRVDLGPLRPLVGQSPVLARLRDLGAGARTVDTLRNMPMVVGLNPAQSYRTLDLPALEPLNALAMHLPRKPAEVAAVVAAIRSTGAGVRVFDPPEVAELERRRVELPGKVETIDDPALAGWTFGADLVAQKKGRASTFRVWTPPASPARAWLVPLTPGRPEMILGEWSGDPAAVVSALAGAEPLAVERPGPAARVVRLRTTGPAVVVLSELADPEWRAAWVRPEGERPADVRRAFGRANHGAWQAVQVPGAGEWTLRLGYRGRDVYGGLIGSGVAFAVFLGLFVRHGVGPGRGDGGEGR